MASGAPMGLSQIATKIIAAVRPITLERLLLVRDFISHGPFVEWNAIQLTGFDRSFAIKFWFSGVL